MKDAKATIRQPSSGYQERAWVYPKAVQKMMKITTHKMTLPGSMICGWGKLFGWSHRAENCFSQCLVSAQCWASTEILPTKYAFTYDCKKDVKFHFRRVVIYWCKWFRKKWLLCMELSVTQNNSLLCRIHLPFCFGSETPVVLICTNMNI